LKSPGILSFAKLKHDTGINVSSSLSNPKDVQEGYWKCISSNAPQSPSPLTACDHVKDSICHIYQYYFKANNQIGNIESPFSSLPKSDSSACTILNNGFSMYMSVCDIHGYSPSVLYSLINTQRLCK
jgi:hypothetical protein